MLELLKLIVQPVVLERDEDGRVVGERLGEPTALYTAEQLTEYREAIERELVAQQVLADQREGSNDADRVRADGQRHLR